FFSHLTGLAEVMVEEVSPRESEMISEGAEYLLALRGDPVSRTALLSTSIQTSMLMMRAMDPSNQSTSKGLFGKRVFAFTDDIDVTNRFYFGLMDAEGRNDQGDPDHGRHPNGPLAAIRRIMPSISRDRAGQNWTMVTEIGHQLTERKRIGRTSSQDPGVVRGLDLIVATASLEVGFNDPGVGCVIQHKAPRDSAQFLQRKGRAGRPRGMRPWTVIVLSDYGRDRLSYQGYEQLFEPEIRPRHLPLSSRYIQRMQATYAVLDFLARELGPLLIKGSAWKSLSEPSKSKSSPSTENQRRSSLAGLLIRILEDPLGQTDLEEYLQDALKLKPKEVQPLLWEYPRPILTSVIPTAIRRLSSNWQYFDNENADFSIRNNPLPEFIPGNLFRDLNLPEVKISLPPDWESHEQEIQMLGIEQGMKTFAPGRVSRRYGVNYSRIRHWVAPEDAGREQTEINISDFYDTEFLGNWLIMNGEEASPMPVFRPHEIRPVRPTSEIVDTSNAYLVWRTQISAKDLGVPLGIPSDSVWSDLISEVSCFRHADHAPVTVRRFSLGSEADIRVRGGESYQARFQYVNEGEQVALGFSLSVDAIRFGLKLPDNLWMRVANTPKLERAIRTEYYFNSDLTFRSLPMVENPFMRDWLADIYFVALNQTALNEHIGLSDASDALAEERVDLALSDVLESFFQSPPSANDEGEQSQDNRNSDQLRQDLELLISRSDIRDALNRHSKCLWEPLDESWEPMLRQTFLSTLGAATHAAITGLCSEVDPSSLILDLDPGPRESDDIYVAREEEEFWITETSPGGVGAIEEFFALFNEDPRIFYSLIESELQPNEYFQTDFQLRRLLSTLSNEQDNTKLREAITNVRKSDSSYKTEQAMVTFRRELADSGYVLYHGFISAITTRLLRPGASDELDSFLNDLVLNWEHFEENLGVDLDGRSLAYFYSRNDEIDQILLSVGLTLPEMEHRASWRFNTVYGLLWRRGREVSRVGLEPYNPFNKLIPSERLLVSSYLLKQTDVIYISDSDWKELAIERLSSWGTVSLCVSLKDKSLLADALRFFAVNPIESAYLSIYARVAGFRNIENSVVVDLELEEVFR
ncbi:protein DpdJ, partial [Methylophaga pinxianii]